MKKQCPKCSNLFTTKGNNYEKHIKACDGSYERWIKKLCCVHCSLDFTDLNASERANHTRWCDFNPKRKDYVNDTHKMRSAINAKSREKISLGVKTAHTNGKYKNAAKKTTQTKITNGTLYHTDETKQKLREKALASKHRRILRSTRIYIKKDGTEVLLDSSWEEALAIRLDNLNVDWFRPEPIEWIDKNGKKHNYFPDFYLPKYNIYLDPKNEQVYKISLEKIEQITKVLPNLIILKTLSECKNFTIENWDCS